MNQTGETYTSKQVRDALRKLANSLSWCPEENGPCQWCKGYRDAIHDTLRKFGGRPR